MRTHDVRTDDTTTISKGNVESNTHSSLRFTSKVRRDPSRASRIGGVLTDADKNHTNVACRDLMLDVRCKCQEHCKAQSHDSHLTKNERSAPLDAIREFGKYDR